MKEAAECLGLSVPAVKTRHLRAKRLILKVAKEVCPPAPNLGNAYQWRLGCSHQYAHSGAAASSRFSLGDSGGGKWLYDSHKKHVGVERENSHHF
jgi:hypothetical protein